MIELLRILPDSFARRNELTVIGGKQWAIGVRFVVDHFVNVTDAWEGAGSPVVFAVGDSQVVTKAGKSEERRLRKRYNRYEVG